MIQEAISKTSDGRSLTSEEARIVMTEIMDGSVTPAQFGALVTALRLKGETVDEISAFAEVMRSRARPLQTRRDLLDTCGTGGDGTGTFNISTAAALVVAGGGQPVAKHGNRAASSKCGSADVLMELGVKIELTAPQVETCIEKAGIAFMFAPSFHPSMKFAAGPRREIAIRTVFNILGPLTNPAHPRFQVLGISDPRLLENMARSLSNLGSKHALVVHGPEGLDELGLNGPNDVCELRDGWTTRYQLSADEVGLGHGSLDEVRGGDSVENAAIIRQVLNGDKGPRRDIVLLNAGAALYASEKASTVKAGIQLAAQSIDSGSARHALETLVTVTNALDSVPSPEVVTPQEEIYPPRFLWDVD